MTAFSELARVLTDVTTTSSRNQKLAILSAFLKSLGHDEIGAASLFLAGRLFPQSDNRTLNVSWKGLIEALRKVVDFQDQQLFHLYEGDTGQAVEKFLEMHQGGRQETLFSEPLSITSVSADLSRIAESEGTGSRREKEAVLAKLLSDATPREARYLVALILGDMRTGVSDTLLVEAIARAFDIESQVVQRAWNLTGNISKIAVVARTSGEKGLREIGLEIMRPLRPMLASPLDSISEIPDDVKGYAFEFKFDGARVQIHRSGNDIRIFSRALTDVTTSMPEVVEQVSASIPTGAVIFDGEVIAVDKSGKPFPFQIVMKRYGRSRDIETKREEIRLNLRLFDVLYLDGQSLLDEPYSRRREVLASLCPAEFAVESYRAKSLDSVAKYHEKSRSLGHEGLVAKKLDSAYQPGVRGTNWLKIKHNLDPMDLCIVAAEWGHGRRSKWLSDFHLAVRDADTNEFLDVGKTFKGLTDSEFEEMTARLKRISIGEKRGVVSVRPEIVVAVLASEIQESPRYKSRMALRFARITAIRDDKPPSDVMTLQDLRALFDAQFRFKAR